jgi:hypothetical protein
MLDRLSAGLVTLPDATYDLIIVLADANGTRIGSTQMLTRDVFSRIVQALKAGGGYRLRMGPLVKIQQAWNIERQFLQDWLLKGAE